MLDFQQKRKVRNMLYNKVTIAVLFLLVLLVLHSTWSVYKKEKESESIKSVSVQKVETLRARSADLDQKIHRLRTEEGVEEEIRSKYSVAKANESMVIVVDETDHPSATSTTQGFWAKITGFFNKK